MGLRPLACWDCGFESRRGLGCLSRVSVVCCQVSGSGRSFIQRSPTECSVPECDCEASTMRSPWPTRDWCAMKKKYMLEVAVSFKQFFPLSVLHLLVSHCHLVHTFALLLTDTYVKVFNVLSKDHNYY